MTDLTPLFTSLLTQHLTSPPIPRKARLPTTPFLAEAHRTAVLLHEISQHLTSTHQPYLSLTSTAYTETDRNTLDATIQSLLRQALSLINRLQQTETIRATTAAAVRHKKRNTWQAIFTSAVDGGTPEHDPEEQAEKMIAAHHESVLWWLKEQLAQCSEIQRRRQEVRLRRKLEKGRSVLAEQKGANVGIRSTTSTSAKKKQAGKGRVKAGMEEDEDMKDVEEQLGAEVVKMLEQENEGMLKYYEDTLEQVKAAETSLLEISELQTKLVTQLSEQSTLIDNLMQDSMTTEENVSKGNKELKKAAERTSIARSAFFASVIFSSVVVVWDLFI
ncbi:hypothetical protein EX30DRAFT_176765 [Ascodesmis nigricans]|uniref:t-SNARE coiled-coil homology domain-containing protein n=1 Tax=Ascodesmis nigricans TaxID=341454 RepID=A0A4S2ML75_9PEZI|nr:hypothetical protein EX30DRAFT_176765 [Ascodesmis nigricans]